MLVIRVQLLRSGGVMPARTDPATPNALGGIQSVLPVSLQGKDKQGKDKVKRGTDALAAMGMPHEFAAQIMLQCAKYGTAMAIRAGKPFQIYEQACAPKPSVFKTKTSTWGPMAGMLTFSEELGRIDKETKQVVKRDVTKQEMEALYADRVQHSVPLSQIIRGIEKGEYERIVDPRPEYSNLLIVRSLEPYAPKGNEVVFAIDLTKAKRLPVIDKALIATHRKLVREEHEKPPKKSMPPWWKDQWGDFKEKKSLLFPVTYKASADSEFQSLDVYGYKGLPVTGDMDLLWIAPPGVKNDNPYKAQIDAVPGIHEVQNTCTLIKVEDAISNMAEVFILPFVALKETLDTKYPVNMNIEHYRNFGCGTPYEYFLTTQINTGFKEAGVTHFENLFQHGAENHNPDDKSSDLNETMLHIYDGQIVLTNDERELVDFVLETPGYLERFAVSVPKGWDMNLWAPVIAKQLSIGQEVSKETLKSYNAHLKRQPLEIKVEAGEINQRVPSQQSISYTNGNVKRNAALFSIFCPNFLAMCVDDAATKIERLRPRVC